MTEEIKDLFKNLSPREQDVISLLLGLNGLPKTPEEIGALYCVDKNEILKIADQALPKIPVTIEELKATAEKAHKELKNKTPERKPRRILSDYDNELLNIKFFEKSEK